MYVRPPPIHTGSKEGTAAAAAPDDSSPTGSAEGTDKVSPSINSTVASIDCGSPGDKTFVENIHALLQVPSYSPIISWNDAGTAVIVHDVEAFISTIMPVHFKHSQFGSFTRRMRRWGFRVTKKLSSPPSPPVPTERGKSNVLEFSSEFFLRDQPELCLMMKDERQAKKKFQFLDRNVRKTDGVENNQASLPGVGGYYPPLSSTTMGGQMKTPPEGNHPIPVHFPSSFPNVNTASNQAQSQQTNTGAGTGTGSLNNMGMNDGYLHSYSQDISTTPMISPSSIHSSMPRMNMMMPPNVPQVQYNPYGYNVPPPGSGYGQASASPGFQYSTQQYAYPPPLPQEQEQQLMQQHQQQMQTQQTQQHQQQPNQQYPRLPPTAASFFQSADARASVVLTSSLSQSSSDELPTATTNESAQLDLLPTKKSPNRPVRSQLDTEQDAQESRERR